MPYLGMVRRLDSLGRLVLPKEVRNVNGWGIDTEIEMVFTDEGVLLKPFRVAHQCYICGDQQELVKVFDRCLCKGCAKEASEGKPVIGRG